MASWIVHMRIADFLLSYIPNLDAPLFTIGNIAPDSGVPDEKWEKFEPPPDVTHFHQSHERRELGDLLFYREYLQPLSPAQDPLRFSFLLGYFCHLVTDNLWAEKIGRPTQARYAAQFAADKDFIWEVKKDWYGLDFLYVLSHPQSLFWRVFLSCSYDRQDLPFLPPNAVQQRICYIQDYYRSKTADDPELQRPYEYLSEAEMDAFVGESSQFLLEVYRRLWVEGQAAPEGISVVSLG
jgi:hypothetical protein